MPKAIEDESVMEGRHLTPEERIALQAEEIKQLWQENEQLQAKLDEWKYEAKCHMDEVIAREKQIEQLRAQVARMREALIECVNASYDMIQDAREVLAEIDKAIGGEKDV